MSKPLKVASLVATGAALGALAGKVFSDQISKYRKLTADSAPGAKRFMETTAVEDEKDFFFI